MRRTKYEKGEDKRAPGKETSTLWSWGDSSLLIAKMATILLFSLWQSPLQWDFRSSHQEVDSVFLLLEPRLDVCLTLANRIWQKWECVCSEPVPQGILHTFSFSGNLPHGHAIQPDEFAGGWETTEHTWLPVEANHLRATSLQLT